MTDSTYRDAANTIERLSNLELDHELEQAAILNEKSEMLVCCYLSAVHERRAFVDFGFSNVDDYANERFGFGPRKARYLVSLGRKIDQLPTLREALASGKIGWCKASREASVANADNEVMWLESALSLTVQQLERRIKDGTDTLATTLHLSLTEEQRILWENALEIYRRRAGAELSPVEAFELILAEAVAEWGLGPHVPQSEDVPETFDDVEVAAEEPSPKGDPTVFPWAEPFETERASEDTLPKRRHTMKCGPWFSNETAGGAATPAAVLACTCRCITFDTAAAAERTCRGT